MIFGKFCFPPNFFYRHRHDEIDLSGRRHRGAKTMSNGQLDPKSLMYIYIIHMQQYTLMRQHITRPPTPIVFVQPPNV